MVTKLKNSNCDKTQNSCNGDSSDSSNSDSSDSSDQKTVLKKTCYTKKNQPKLSTHQKMP